TVGLAASVSPTWTVSDAALLQPVAVVRVVSVITLVPASGKLMIALRLSAPSAQIVAFVADHSYRVPAGAAVSAPKFWYRVPPQSVSAGFVAMTGITGAGRTVTVTCWVSAQPFAMSV